MAAELNAGTLYFARRPPGCLPSATFYPEPVTDYVTAVSGSCGEITSPIGERGTGDADVTQQLR
jgi:hypothetical protein